MRRPVNRRLPGFLVAAAFALAVIGHSDAFAAPEPSVRAEFQAAYGRYQQAIEDKNPQVAAAAAKEALDLGPSVLSDDSPSLAALYVNYGMALVEVRRFDDAFAPLRAGIKRLEKLHGKTHESLIDPLYTLAEAYRAGAVQNDKGIVYLKRILRIVERTRGKDNLLFAEINQLLGKTMVLSNFPRNRKRAVRHLTTAYETYQRLYDRPAYKTGLAAFWLGKSRLQDGKYKAAEEHFLDALHLFEETSPPGHELQLMAHGFLIALYEERGKSSQADAHVRTVALLRPSEGVDGHKPLYKLAPVYPRSARVLGREGFVLVEFTVTTRGTVTNIRVLGSEGGKDIEDAALEAIKSYRYAPAIRNGEPVVTVGVRNKIIFSIAN